MASLKDYITLSDTSSSLASIFVTPSEFKKILSSIKANELDSTIRHLIIDNISYAFKEKPLLLEQLKEYLGDILQVDVSQVKLIGSAKTGFSISTDHFGRLFKNSDLDFAIYNSGLFEKVVAEFSALKEQYEKNQLTLTPKNMEYWVENIILIPMNIKRGFIDPYKIPNVQHSPVTSKIATILANIQQHLKKTFEIDVKKPSVRIYKDYQSFISVLKSNTLHVMSKLPEEN